MTLPRRGRGIIGQPPRPRVPRWPTRQPTVRPEQGGDLGHDLRGSLAAIMWPLHLGVSVGDLEPFGEDGYERGPIEWEWRDGHILGKARVWVPKGTWTHHVFCTSPLRDSVMDRRQMEHPLIFDRPGFVDVDPITFLQVLPRI